LTKFLNNRCSRATVSVELLASFHSKNSCAARSNDIPHVRCFRFSLTLLAVFLFLQETDFEQQGFFGIGGLGGFLVLSPLGVVPNEPDELRLGMPAQSRGSFGRFLSFTWIYFVQISNFVKRTATILESHSTRRFTRNQAVQNKL
jgi:hypothetical protein